MLLWDVAVVCLTLVVSKSYAFVNFGPVVLPTEGGVWPSPVQEVRTGGSVLINPDDFKILVQGIECEIVTKAVIRYMVILQAEAHTPGPRDPGDASANLPALVINVTGTCENMPHLDMVETYELRVNTPDLPNTALLSSQTVWGILRGLETFIQLATRVQNGGSLIIDNIAIVDYPRFQHRGLLLDTSRHYFPVSLILNLLDALVMNKMNIFHWHIVDDQSFPYQSVVYPELSVKGAFTPSLIYTQESIAEIIEQARLRGIRVVAEFDSPGHTRSWGAAEPSVLTECYSSGVPNGILGPMDPTKNYTYEVVENLFAEIVNVFPDAYFHIGGDEVNLECWESNPEIQQYMRDAGINDTRELESIYINRVLEMMHSLQSKYIVWQEVFDNNVNLANDTVIHVWKSLMEEEEQNITAAGFKMLVSSCWYMDHLQSGGDWQQFYECDPTHFTNNTEGRELVVGGEACMWAEFVDESNLMSRLWPRASAVAERLWSQENVNIWVDAQARLEEHYCRMKRRGITAQPPNGPGFCP